MKALTGGVPVGVSACLLGERVRHDGNHRRNAFLVEELGPWLRFVSFCPEVAAGLGVPRPTLRQVRHKDGPLRVLEAGGVDRSELLEHTAGRLAEQVGAADLSGFVLKSGSPTCGMDRVRVYNEHGIPTKDGEGLFARALRRRLPLLPVEEEGRLCDPHLRENFLLRVFTHRRFYESVKQAPSVEALIRFHTAHKFVLLAHDEARARQLGRLVGNAEEVPLAERIARYEEGVFAALSEPASPRHHQNALHHAAGFLKDRLDDVERQQLHEVIERYGAGEVPLVVPLTVLRVFQARVGSAYLEEQVYLDPLPAELRLYNQV